MSVRSLFKDRPPQFTLPPDKGKRGDGLVSLGDGNTFWGNPGENIKPLVEWAVNTDNVLPEYVGGVLGSTPRVNGGVYICGRVVNIVRDLDEAFVQSRNEDGGLVWAKELNDVNSVNGTAQLTSFYDVIEVDEAVYAVGYHYGDAFTVDGILIPTTPIDSGMVLICKFNANDGTLLKVVQTTGETNNGRSETTAVSVVRNPQSSGELFIVGNFKGVVEFTSSDKPDDTQGNIDGFLIKYSTVDDAFVDNSLKVIKNGSKVNLTGIASAGSEALTLIFNCIEMDNNSNINFNGVEFPEASSPYLNNAPNKGFICNYDITSEVFTNALECPLLYGIARDSDSDSDIYVCGYSFETSPLIGPKSKPTNIKTVTATPTAYYSKLTSDLTGVLWSSSVIGAGDQPGTGPTLQDIAVDPQGGSIYITGSFNEEGCYFGPTELFIPSENKGITGQTIFVAKVDAEDGVVDWVSYPNKIEKPFSEDRSYGRTISVSPIGNVYYGGEFTQKLDFGPPAGTIDRVGGQEAFLAKITPNASILSSVVNLTSRLSNVIGNANINIIDIGSLSTRLENLELRINTLLEN